MRVPGLSIGAVSRATGIPAETLRTWEARYGFPAPDRGPSGHRVYPVSIVPRLTRMAEALARGQRAATVIGASDAALGHLLGTGRRGGVERREDATAEAARPPEFLDAVALFDGERLTRVLHADWARLEALEFLDRRIAPLLAAVGDGWRAGRFDVRHEHFVTERLSDLLRALRRPHDDRLTGPLVVLATLPGERHALGLLMAALVVARAGGRPLNLGPDVPVREIARAAAERRAEAVAVSISSATAGAQASRQVTRLRTLLTRRATLILGGAGAPSTRRAGVLTLGDLRRLDGWVREHASASRSGARIR